jgi:hypothetical protein
MIDDSRLKHISSSIMEAQYYVNDYKLRDLNVICIYELES